jgi:hypothetical protein
MTENRLSVIYATGQGSFGRSHELRVANAGGAPFGDDEGTMAGSGALHSRRTGRVAGTAVKVGYAPDPARSRLIAMGGP